MKYPQLKEKVLELPKHLRKQLFQDLLRSFKSQDREGLIPDDVCTICLCQKTEGVCWNCFESGPPYEEIE